ncbi:P450-derived glycosyltransferase activator [Streptomyces sp. NBC_01275]|uniref:cytochrome P450 family protein n=1 Tax=Streptomyces sp. NBC_01275 TaxID=2903807 RepID=UPI00224C93A0|nr:P450-derived glycosyltransferase activator [Streptomyces sp. NBC_01275]MCX4766663.1 P450-derived glycosyltransferase activator [Streptomyces sp. NBC_01275]
MQTHAHNDETTAAQTPEETPEATEAGRQTDSELGRHLLTARGFHWIYGTSGDPYALTLRAESDDPALLTRRIRDEAGPLWQSAAGAWVTGRHAVAAQALADPRLSLRHADLPGPQRHVFSDAWSNPQLCHIVPLDRAFLHASGADHARWERSAAPVLGAAAAEGHRKSAELVHQETADGLGESFDLMADYSRPTAVAAAAALLGVPAAQRDRFAEACLALGVALDAALCPQPLAVTRRLEEAVEDVRALVGDLVAARRGEPGDDLLSVVLRAEDSAVFAQDALAVGVLTAVVGVEFAAGLVNNTLEALLAHPLQWAMLGESPDLAAGAVEEALRYAPPVRLESRIAAEELELGGQVVPAGAQVVVHVGAANRDPEAFLAPDHYDLTRPAGQGRLSLAGPHTGLFGAFARLQAETAVRTLRERHPELTPAGGVLRRMRSPVLGGVLRFPLATSATTFVTVSATTSV